MSKIWALIVVFALLGAGLSCGHHVGSADAGGGDGDAATGDAGDVDAGGSGACVLDQSQLDGCTL